MMWIQVLWLLLAAETLCHVSGQTAPVSPCPALFWYEVDTSGNWHGRMNIPAPPTGSSLKTVVELEIDATLHTSNVGTLKLVENENEVWRRISAGNNVPVRFYVYFPLSWPLPILRSITSNGNFICIDTTSHTLMTKVTLQHLLYPTGGNANYVTNPNMIQGPSGSNYYPNIPNTLNDPLYVVKPRMEVPDYDQGLNVSSVSTCPGVFDYQRSISGEWYGRINIQNPFPILVIDMVVELYVTGEVPMNTKGSLKPANNLLQEWNRIKAGENFFIQYKLEFPTFKPYGAAPPLPTIKSIIVNDRVLCSGDMPRYSVVITVTYKHSIYSDKCTSSSLKCPDNMAQSALPAQPPPGYGPSPPVYDTTQPSSPRYDTSTHVHESTSTYSPITPTYKPPAPVTPVYRAPPPTTTTYRTPPPTTTTYRTSPPEYTYTPSRTEIVMPPRPKIGSSNKIQCGTIVIKNSPLIAYGEETYAGQWPWHAALYLYMKRDIKFTCGGSFVGTRTVITAAHCVNRKGELLKAEDFIIYLGRYNLRNMNEEGLQYHGVRNILVHPSYNGTYSVGDVAVLILSTSVEVTPLVRPVCLWGQDDTITGDIIDRVGLVVGWGLDERDEPTETLMMVKMPVVNRETCIISDPSFYTIFTSDGTFCAGYRNGSSVCNGDSGGGMVFPMQKSDGTEVWFLRGIVSHGRRRDSYSEICDAKGYIVFTDVLHYLDWINDILI